MAGNPGSRRKRVLADGASRRPDGSLMDFVIVDLAPACNNRGLQPPGTHGNGAYGFNIWSNTFPAEQLPAPGSIVEISGVPFTFPAGAVPAGAAPAGDNIRCRGQRIP